MIIWNFQIPLIITFKKILHKDSRNYNVSYLVPVKLGEFKIKYEIICNEYEDAISDEFTLVME